MRVFPLVRIYLPPRDDAAEFDEGGVDLAGHVDEKEVVLWRKSNKVLPVTWKTRRTGLLHVSGHVNAIEWSSLGKHFNKFPLKEHPIERYLKKIKN